MEYKPNKLSLEESIKKVMQTLPPVIRTYLGQGKYTPVAKNLMTRYSLHIDQGTVLEREIMLLLMGIEDPDEFSEALRTEARLSEQVVKNIMLDVNAQIFIPLREEMQKGGVGQKPMQVQQAPKVVQQQPPKLQQQAQPQTPRPNPAVVNQPKPLPAPPQPTSQRSDLAAAIQKATQVIQTPVSSTPSVPILVPSQPAPVINVLRTLATTPAKPPASERSYSVDPYREPLDESK